MAVTLDLRDQASPFLRRLSPETLRRNAALVGGRALVNTLRLHFFKLDSERPNALGGRRTHFYSQVARSVQNPRGVSEGVMVSINHVGIAQRYFGGDLRPVNAERLSIPAREEYYGKRPREFDNLHYVRFSSGTEALVENVATNVRFRKNKGGLKTSASGETGGGVAYWLKKEVHQDKDPSVLPDQAEMEAAVGAAVNSYVQRQISPGPSTPPAP